jgi:hypothetical protein
VLIIEEVRGDHPHVVKLKRLCDLCGVDLDLIDVWP